MDSITHGAKRRGALSAGFMLIEVLCALLCLMIILTSWYAFRITMIKKYAEMEATLEAVTLARSFAQELYQSSELLDDRTIGGFVVSMASSKDHFLVPTSNRRASKKQFETIAIKVNWAHGDKPREIMFITGALIAKK